MAEVSLEVSVARKWLSKRRLLIRYCLVEEMEVKFFTECTGEKGIKHLMFELRNGEGLCQKLMA